jgi:hypothetical protein
MTEESLLCESIHHYPPTLGRKVLLKSDEFRKNIVQEGPRQREGVYERQFPSIGFRLYGCYDTSSSDDDLHFLWQIFKANWSFRA